MGKIVLLAERRPQLGKNASRRVRSRGKIPAVVYGRGLETASVSVDAKEVYQILHSEKGHNTIFELNLDSNTTDVLIKDYQLDPVEGGLLHADFQSVSMDQEMTFNVPVRAMGTAAGTIEGGVLDAVLREIQVECLPGDVPDHIQVDVAALEIGDSIRIANLQIEISGVKVLSNSNLVVFSVVPPHVETEPDLPEEEGEETELIGEDTTEQEKEEEEK